MTEEEAKKKWCPKFKNTSINGRGGSSNNRKSLNEQTFTNECICIASDCIMWKFTDEYDENSGYCGLTK